MIRKALIVTGGFCNVRAIAGRLPETDLIIAADSGQNTCRALGLTPHLICGDFDSSAAPADGTAELVRVPVRKDVTDTMLACNIAAERGAAELTIVGGTGGRLDHTFSNVFFLEGLKRRGIEAVLTDGENTVRVLYAGDSAVLQKGRFRYFSVFALTDSVVSESGCSYPLADAPLRRDDPYAVSNEITDETAIVSVRTGTILLTESGLPSDT